MIIRACESENCTGLTCERLKAQSRRWRRSFGTSQRVEDWFGWASNDVNARNVTTHLLNQTLDLSYATDLDGVKKQVPSDLVFEVHEGVDDGGHTLFIAMYVGDEDPIEIMARMPVWEELK